MPGGNTASGLGWIVGVKAPSLATIWAYLFRMTPMPVETDAGSGAGSAGVVLCTYNGANYLPQQLNSILAQSVRVDEVIISDDASSDSTVEMLSAFAARARAMGIRVELLLRTENVGFVRNFSEALSLSAADLVFPCDQDDVWHERRVEVFLERFAADPSVMLLHGNAQLVDANGAALGETLVGALRIHRAELALESTVMPLDALLVRNLVTGATAAVRRPVIEHGLPIAAGWVHDEWLAVVAAVHGQIGFVTEPMVDYRQHGRNQIGAKRESFVQRLRRLELFAAPARQRAVLRYAALIELVHARQLRLAPTPLSGCGALCWRITWSRLRMYRRHDVSWRWIAYDVPNMLVRVASVCLAGGGVSALWAGVRGGWVGWRGAR